MLNKHEYKKTSEISDVFFGSYYSSH